MEKEFVPYELAVKLKTLGFDEPCLAVFNDSKQFRINSESTNWNGNVKNGDTTSSPLYQQAFRWFREKHDLFISIYHYDSGYEINDLRRFGTYEEAQLARLTKLIEIIETEKLKIMKKKQSSIEQVFSHIKASRNDIHYWNDSMLVDWLLEQEDRLKAMHEEEIKDAYIECWMNDGGNGFHKVKEAEQYYNETFGGNNE